MDSIVVDSHFVAPNCVTITVITTGQEIKAGDLVKALERAAGAFRAKAIQATREIEPWEDAPIYRGPHWKERHET